MTGKPSATQIIWGISLILAGLGVIFMIPHRMEQLQALNYTSSATAFIRVSFYLIALLLIGGGVKKFLPPLRSDMDVAASDAEPLTRHKK